jgi:uroporphyrinogen decarboxylase
MNKREFLLNLIEGKPNQGYVPAGFFMHFGPKYQKGPAAIEKHLEFYRRTGMDFVKIQYEGGFPSGVHIQKPDDWANVPLVDDEFFEAPLEVVEGLVKAARHESLVVVTIYSPFMWVTHLDSSANIINGLEENPTAVRQGLEIMTENVLKFVRGCKRLGVDGFYTSTQGGETFRFGTGESFQKFIKPTDLAIWEEIEGCDFNILHVCDYEGTYADLSAFLDYPGQVVNCSLKLDGKVLLPKEIARMFERPFMGGLDRKGIITSPDKNKIRQKVINILEDAPERFILAADCTVPGETPWENLRAAIDTAHNFRR